MLRSVDINSCIMPAVVGSGDMLDLDAMTQIWHCDNATLSWLGLHHIFKISRVAYASEPPAYMSPN